MAASTSTPMLSAVLPILLSVAIFRGGGGSSSAVGAKTALDDLCGGLGGYYVTPELCASALCYDPSLPCHAARDAPALAALAARLAAANATATRDSIAAALSSRADGTSNSIAAGEEEVKAAVRSCLGLYTGAVPSLRWAAQSAAAGRYPGAREVLQGLQYIALGCEGMAGGAAALPKENDGFGTMAIVAHAVLASMSTGY